MDFDFTEFLAGSIGGIAGVLVGKPFDTVKVRLITDDRNKPRYRGTTHCFTDIFKTEGIHGFYKGVMSPIYGQAAINAIVFGVHSNVLRNITDDKHCLAANFIAGATAGAAQSVVCSPVELVRIRMETQGIGESYKHSLRNATYSSPSDCLKKIYRAEGLRGVYRGFITTILRESPSFGVYFISYEWLTLRMKQFMGKNKDSELSIMPILVAGGMAGMLTWFSTYPVDVVKTRIQEDICGKYKGNIDCLLKVLKEGGVRSLYRGVSVCLLRAFPANAATFAAYEWTARMVKRSREAAKDKSGYVLLSQESFTVHARDTEDKESETIG